MSSEKQLLKCFWAPEQTEPLSTGHQVITQLEPPVESCWTDQVTRLSGPSDDPQWDGRASSLSVSGTRGHSKQRPRNTMTPPQQSQRPSRMPMAVGDLNPSS